MDYRQRRAMPPITTTICWSNRQFFYALAFYTHLAGLVDPIAVMFAWGYVILRVLHSLVQTSVNIVMIRFGLFYLINAVPDGHCCSQCACPWVKFGNALVKEPLIRPTTKT